MVDWRTLFFCKSFDPHKNMENSITVTDQFSNPRQHYPNYRNKKQPTSSNRLMSPPCNQSSTAAVDIVMVILVLGACGFLIFPYVEIVFHGIAEIGAVTLSVIEDEMDLSSPLVYLSLGVSFLLAIVAVWGIFLCRGKKCDNPNCRGLWKAAEFDIQLETEDCMKNLPSPSIEDDLGRCWLKLGEIQQRELEAQLRKMAPPNGRAVLIFRARCGCSVGGMEVLGQKKTRKAKK